jgi:hypothetical protein
MKTEINQIIERVIECSRHHTYADLENIFPNRNYYGSFLAQIQEDIKDEVGVNFIHQFDVFYRLADKYDFDSLSHLIKGLTMAENHLNLHESVSSIIPLYSRLLKNAGYDYYKFASKFDVGLFVRNLEDLPNEKIVTLTNWIIEHTDNIYLPFGISTLNSKTIVDINSEIEFYFEETKSRERQERADKEKRDKEREEKTAKNIKKHQAKTKVDSEYRLSLGRLSTSELLSQILKDDKRAIYFYSHELSNIVSIEQENIRLLKKVILRFKENESRHFKRLKDQLRNIAKE